METSGFKHVVYVAYACFFFALMSCGDGDTGSDKEPMMTMPTYTSIDTITGISLYDENGQGIGRWHSPNDNPGDHVVFPNPSNGNLQLYSESVFSNLWLLPASCASDNDPDIVTASNDVVYGQDEIESLALLTLMPPDNQPTSLRLDFSSEDKGFYRLFLKTIDGDIFWQNIFINPSVVNFPDTRMLDEHCGS